MRVTSRALLPLVLPVLLLMGCKAPSDSDSDTETAYSEPAATAPVGSAAELSDAERDEIADAIKARNKELVAAWNQQDATDEWLAFFAAGDRPDLLVVNFDNWDSTAEIAETFRPILADRATAVSMRDESVAVLSPTEAVHFGEFTYTLTRGGKTSEPYLAAATSVWTLEDGQWKVLHYHQSWPNQTPVPASQAGVSARS